jgi:hypothetical protein
MNSSNYNNGQLQIQQDHLQLSKTEIMVLLVLGKNLQRLAVSKRLLVLIFLGAIGSRKSAVFTSEEISSVGSSTNHALQRSSSELSMSRPNLAIDTGKRAQNLFDTVAATIDPNAKVQLTIMSSTTFATGVFSKTRGARVYYLLDVQRNGARAGMLLRNYKHFEHLQQKVILINYHIYSVVGNYFTSHCCQLPVAKVGNVFV